MISLEKIAYEIGENILFKDVSFRIQRGDRMALVGKNGAGKSTFLSILSSKLKPSSGAISYEKGIKVGFLEQQLVFEKNKTLFEELESVFVELNNLKKRISELSSLIESPTHSKDKISSYLEELQEKSERYEILEGYKTKENIEKIAFGLGFERKDFEKLASDFSGGWKMRMQLAKLLLNKSDLLLLDEPTNHLDIESILWIENFLKNYEGALILISHDRQFIKQISNSTLEISNKKIKLYKYHFSKYLEIRDFEKENLIKSQKNQEKEIERKEKLVEKFRSKASKASFAQKLIKELDKTKIIEVEKDDLNKMNFFFTPCQRSGKEVVEIKDLSKQFGEKIILSSVNLSISRGEKIAFVGKNGQGKSTLAKIIAGELSFDKGTLNLGHNVNLGYFAQNQAETLDLTKTVLQEAEDASSYEMNKNVRNFLGAFLFSKDEVDKKVGVLSGGEKNRLALCKLLLQPSNILILDEPTNHLDVESKEVLKRALQSYEGTCIVVSHDREFLEGLIEKVFEFENGNTKEHLGGLEDYLKKKKIKDFRELEKSNNLDLNKEIEGKDAKTDLKKEVKKKRNAITKLENEITSLEKQIKSLEAQFAFGSSDEQALEAYKKIQNELQEKMKRWESLQEE